jgi:hypothetical protein
MSLSLDRAFAKRYHNKKRGGAGLSKREAFVLLAIILSVFVLVSGTFPAVNINWGAWCNTDSTIQDQNKRRLKGTSSGAGCGHRAYDVVYLVWDRDVDGIENFNCLRQLSGDTIIDSTFIGTNIFCLAYGCSTGGFSRNKTWTVDGTLDTLYVIALNDTTRILASYFGSTIQHNPSIWTVHKDSVSKKIPCTLNSAWYTNIEFPGTVSFNGVSISNGTTPGAKHVGMERLGARVSFGHAIWSAMRVDNGPSGGGCTNDYLDIDSVEVWKETAGRTSTFDPASDLMIGEAKWGAGPPAGGKATVTLTVAETLVTDSSFYYIAFDIAPGANWQHCVTACVQDTSYTTLGVPSPGVSDCKDGNFPFCSSDAGLPVEISRFEAFPGDRLVVLQWTTQTEVDNKGFYIYRALSVGGAYSKVNQEIIPGAGDWYLPRDYEYKDTGLSNGTAYYYRLVSVTYGNQLSNYDRVVSVTPLKGARRYFAETGLYGCNPNPFGNVIEISYRLVSNGVLNASLGVYDISGRLVRVLGEGSAISGEGTVSWDGTDAAGRRVPPGLYFCRLKADRIVSVMKIVKAH